MIDNQTKNISDFTQQLYHDDFYGGGQKTKNKNKKYIFEFNYIVFLKYLFYESLLAGFIYLILKYRYYNFVFFILSWLLIINGFIWILAIFIFLFMFYESIEIRKIKKTRIYNIESNKIDKLL